MKALKILGYGSICFFVIIAIAVLITLTTIFTYFPLQMFLFGKGDYLLFVSNKINMIPIIMVMILIIYGIFIIQHKFFIKKEEQVDIIEADDEAIDIETLSKLEQFILKVIKKLVEFEKQITKLFYVITKIFNMIKVCYVPILIISIYCGMTSYSILYKGSIKVSSPINPTGTIYKYSNIKNVKVGVKDGDKNTYTPYYKVIFDDGKSVDLFDGGANEAKDIGFEYVLIDLDKKLRAQGVVKTVDKENFEKYSKGLNKEFVGQVEGLFDDN